MLRHWQVEVHSTVNAAILPRSFHQGHGLHRGPFLEEVNRRMLTADGVARMVAVKLGHSAARHVFIDMLKKLGDSIVAGTSDPVAISLQAVLRTSDRAHGHVTQYGTIAANA